MNRNKSITQIDIVDPINETGAVEVVLTLDDGSRRWCFFHSPKTISNCGDFIDGTEIRLHYGAKHMFVVSELSEATIKNALAHVERLGEVLECTKSC